MPLCGQEIQLAEYDGLKGEESFYLRHKDAFKVDSNNLKPGQKMRKLTVITYLNEDIPSSRDKQGQLRLYTDDKIIDVAPRLGRTIVFKSENLEHEVRPTLGYERYAITTWFHCQVPAAEAQVEENKGESLDNTSSIFIGIPSYRDPFLPQTVRSLLEKATNPERLTIAIFL